MIISLSGTPGTGKTTVCKIIREHPQYSRQFHVIDLNKIIIDEKLYSGKDEERDTLEVDMDRLEERVQELICELPQNIDVIMEGHLSHLLPSDAVIVLRTEPVILRMRLSVRKNYSAAKIRENADAEALDIILVESVERSDKVFEINTTEMESPDVVKAVVFIINSLKKGEIPVEFLPGKFDWIEQVERD